MADFVKVAEVDKIPPGTMKKITLNGFPILLVNINGTLHAVSAICTHEAGPLEEGELNGDTITCPLHGSAFRISDGAVMHPPADAPLDDYEVKVQGNDVLIKYG